MRFIFRADSSSTIGAGHIMRSSVVAEEAISQGISSIFIGDVTQLNWLEKYISSIGFDAIYSNLHSFSPDPSNDVLIRLAR